MSIACALDIVLALQRVGPAYRTGSELVPGSNRKVISLEHDPSAAWLLRDQNCHVQIFAGISPLMYQRRNITDCIFFALAYIIVDTDK
jgi:hypothetical protein